MPGIKNKTQNEANLYKYMMELIKLDLALDQSFQDFKSKKQIVYFVDSNICQAFLNPFANWSSINFLIEEEPKKLLQTSLMIAVEHIFSRKLVKCNDFPLYLLESHGDELGKRKKVIVEDISNNLEFFRKKYYAQLDKNKHIIRTLRDEIQSDNQISGKIIENIAESIGAQDFGDLGELAQIIRYGKEDKLRPWLRVPFINPSSLSVSQKAIDEWSFILKQTKSQPDYSELNKKEQKIEESKFDQRIKNDVEALAQLYELNAKAKLEKIPVRYVLITADNAIINAALKRQHDKKSGVILNHNENYVRSILQYIPALNTREMPNGIDENEISELLKSTIDSLTDYNAGDFKTPPVDFLLHLIAIQSKPKISKNVTKNLLYDRLSEYYKKSFEEVYNLEIHPEFPSQLHRLNTNWLNIIKNDAILNLNLLKERFESLEGIKDLLEEVDKELETINLLDTVKRNYYSATEKIEKVHLKWILNTILKQSDPKKQFRSILSICPTTILDEPSRHMWESVEHFEPSDSLEPDDSLEKIYQSNFESFGTIDLYKASYLTACVAYKLGEWKSALEAANRVEHQFKTFFPEEERIKLFDSLDSGEQNKVIEIRFFVALCQRFSLQELVDTRNYETDKISKLKEHFEKAERHHRNLLIWCHRNNSQFFRIRASCELGSLYLTAAIAQLIRSDEIFETDSYILANKALLLLEQAQAMVSSKISCDCEIAYEEVLSQINSNLLTVAILLKIYSRDEVDKNIFFRKSVKSAFAAVDNAFATKGQSSGKYSSSAMPHNEVEFALCNFLIKQNTESKNNFEKKVTEYTDFGHKLGSITKLDEEWMEHYLNNIK